MGTDLVSACIFCAGMLLGIDLTPRPGLGGEMGFSYATMARRYDVTSNRVDSSDVTPKFVLIDLGNAREAKDGLGAGTPVFQWEARVAFGASHDEQERKALEDLERVIATGTGRYENFAVLARIPVTACDSAEVAVNRRAESATDLVNIGGSNHSFSEERSVSASRGDVALGWRHRWQGLEAEAAFRWTKPSGFNATGLSFQQASGNLFGADAELRWRTGRWTLLLHGETISGSMDVHREHSPDFIGVDTSLPASFTVGRLGVGYSWPEGELFLSGTYDRQKLPFVSLAVLGSETVAFDQGFDPNSINDEVYANVGFRYRLTAAIALRIGVTVAWGSETVTLYDAAGALADRQLDVLRRGVFGGGASSILGAPETTLFIGADFAIGAPK
jgi:hypothetical protein